MVDFIERNLCLILFFLIVVFQIIVLGVAVINEDTKSVNLICPLVLLTSIFGVSIGLILDRFKNEK